jgi:hypothetical protein
MPRVHRPECERFKKNLHKIPSDVMWRYVTIKNHDLDMKKQSEVPELTRLQFLIIETIGAKKMLGADLREQLKRHKVRKTGPAFYQLMARLEEAKLVEGWYEQEVIEGQIIKQRRYRVTGLGEQARRETTQFYAQFAGEGMAYA